jgi:restriction system protein
MPNRRMTAAQYDRAVRAAARESERIAKQRELERVRQQKALTIQQGEAGAAQLNQELDARFTALQSILEVSLGSNPAVDFDSLKDRKPFAPLLPPERLVRPGFEPQIEQYLPDKPNLLGKVFGKQKYEHAVEQAHQTHKEAHFEWEQAEKERNRQLDELRKEHQRKEKKYARQQLGQNREVAEFASRYNLGESAAVASYCETVLQRSKYPEDFPREFRLAYISDSKQVVIEYELPTFDVVPEEVEYRYIRVRNEIGWSTMKIGERRSLYTEIVSAVAIRTLHELFAADVGLHVDVVVFNGYVNTVDPATGRDIQPYLITVRATRDEMSTLDLQRIDPMACLRHLKAQVSRSPSELQPVRPIVDFNMVDPRFIEHGEVLTELDKRPNLMELSPGEFETLVTNLFEKMGLETKLTQASRDGGVDCVAYDQRPILGGKVVIQAKRYQHTVGVSAVRDLFGTMHNEGANKGILVTTSDYGKAAFDFANGKPIELINGSNLLYLLGQHGVEAKIEVPEDWQDPLPPS